MRVFSLLICSLRVYKSFNCMNSSETRRSVGKENWLFRRWASTITRDSFGYFYENCRAGGFCCCCCRRERNVLCGRYLIVSRRELCIARSRNPDYKFVKSWRNLSLLARTQTCNLLFLRYKAILWINPVEECFYNYEGQNLLYRWSRGRRAHFKSVFSTFWKNCALIKAHFAEQKFDIFSKIKIRILKPNPIDKLALGISLKLFL